MTIHWFPGHMSTARDELRKAMPGVDLVIEVLDARIPFSSENPLVADLRGARPSIRILKPVDGEILRDSPTQVRPRHGEPSHPPGQPLSGPLSPLEERRNAAERVKARLGPCVSDFNTLTK
jgi:hypothetical protein